MSLDTKTSKIVSVPADLDDECLQGFFDELHSAIGEQPAEIALDCSLLEHTTSRHVNALWDALTRCERAGVFMRLISVGYGTERVLKVLDLAELFTVEYEDERRDTPARRSAPVHPAKRFEAEMETRIEAVTDCMYRLRGFLKQLDLSDIGVFDLETVFYEVATNICRHSGLEQRRKMKFVAELDRDEISFEFTDAGERFDPTGNTPEFDPRLAIRRRQSRGIGLVMIQRLMDAIFYERVDGKFNVVTMRKRFAPPAEVVQ